MGEGDRYIDDGMTLTDTKTGLVCDLGNIDNVSYDIDAEPESNSLTANALEAATFIEMQKNGVPVDPRVIIGKTNLPTDEKIQWIKYIEDSQKAASDANQQLNELEMAKVKNQHEQAMEKLKLEALVAKQKADDAEQKDILKTAIEREKLNVQKERDKQSAQIKMIQIVSGIKLDQEEAKRKMIELMLNADHDRKRLILDVAEVMANASFRGIELQVKALTDMYREALNAETLNAVEETKLAGKVFDVLVRGAESLSSSEAEDKRTDKELIGKLATEKLKADASKEAAQISGKSNNNGGTKSM